MRRSRVAQVVAVMATGLLAGCSSMPLPGGEGGNGYQVSIEFADVTDLVPYSTVKVDDVTVGQVETVSVDDSWVAKVSVRVNNDVELPRNAVARLRQTSVLGEKFVDIAAPTKAEPSGELGNGDSIPLKRTDRGAEIEEVLGAASLLLQGGGLEQLRTINTELSDLMSGREDELKSTLSELETFVASLDEQRADIITALESLEALSADLADQRETIGDALDSIAPGVTELADQREVITDAITALGDLGDTGSEVIAQSRDETIAILNDLQPVLENLVAAGDNLPEGLDMGLTYPFPPNVRETIENDFVNLHITLDGTLDSVLGNLLGGKPIEQAEPDSDEGAALPGEESEEPPPEPLTGGLDDLLGVGIDGDDGDEEE